MTRTRSNALGGQDHVSAAADPPLETFSGAMHHLVFELVIPLFWKDKASLQSLRQVCRSICRAADSQITALKLEYEDLDKAVSTLTLGFPKSAHLKKLTLKISNSFFPRPLFAAVQTRVGVDA